MEKKNQNSRKERTPLRPEQGDQIFRFFPSLLPHQLFLGGGGQQDKESKEVTICTAKQEVTRHTSCRVYRERGFTHCASVGSGAGHMWG